jgi:hypothetical protein
MSNAVLEKPSVPARGKEESAPAATSPELHGEGGFGAFQEFRASLPSESVSWPESKAELRARCQCSQCHLRLDSLRAEVAAMPELRRAALDSGDEKEFARLDFAAKRLPLRIEKAARELASSDVDFWRTTQALAVRVREEGEAAQSDMANELREVKRAVSRSERCDSPDTALSLPEVTALNERWRQLTARLAPSSAIVRRAREVVEICEARAVSRYGVSLRAENTYQRQFLMPADGVLAHGSNCKKMAEKVLR